MNKRRRRVGLLAALLAPALVVALATPASAILLSDPALDMTCGGVPHNLVVNCGFEAGPLGGTAPGWTHLVSNGSSVSDGTGVAHSGAKALVFYSAGGEDVWTQTIPVTPHTQYLLGAWVMSNEGHASAPEDELTIAATNLGAGSTGTAVYSTRDTVIGTWQFVDRFVTTGSGHTLTLSLTGSNVPGDTFVDDVFLTPQTTGCAAIANNLVRNCGFENSSVSPWVNSGTNNDSQVSPNSAYSGHSSLRFASTSTDDVWFQVLTVRPRTQYTLSYWVEYWSHDAKVSNDLHVLVSDVPAATGGVLRISTVNVPNTYWRQVTRTFTTGSGTTAVLMFAGANNPDSTYLDDVSVTAVPHVKIAAKGRTVTTTLTGLGGQKVYLEKLVGSHWTVIRTWTAPKTGWSKSWVVTVGSAGAYRGASAAAPGYGAAASGPIAIK